MERRAVPKEIALNGRTTFNMTAIAVRSHSANVRPCISSVGFFPVPMALHHCFCMSCNLCVEVKVLYKHHAGTGGTPLHGDMFRPSCRAIVMECTLTQVVHEKLVKFTLAATLVIAVTIWGRFLLSASATLVAMCVSRILLT